MWKQEDKNKINLSHFRTLLKNNKLFCLFVLFLIVETFRVMRTFYFLKKIYLFIFDCVGSSFLCEGFL